MSSAKRIIVKKVSGIIAVIAILALASVYVLQNKPQASTTTLLTSPVANCPTGTDIIFAVDNSQMANGTMIGTQTYANYLNSFFSQVPTYVNSSDRVALVTFGSQTGISEPVLGYSDTVTNLGNLASKIPTVKAANPDMLYGMQVATQYADSQTRYSANGAPVPKFIILITSNADAIDTYTTSSNITAAEGLVDQGVSNNDIYITVTPNGITTSGGPLGSISSKLFGQLFAKYTRPDDWNQWPNMTEYNYWSRFIEHYLNSEGTSVTGLFAYINNGHSSAQIGNNLPNNRQQSCLQVTAQSSASGDITAGTQFTVTYTYSNNLPEYGPTAFEHVDNAAINVTLPVGVQYISAQGASLQGTPTQVNNADGTVTLTMNVGNSTKGAGTVVAGKTINSGIATGTTGSITVTVKANENLYAQ